MGYNTLSASMIDTWRQKMETPHIIHKAMLSAFKAAWFESNPRGEVGRELLKHVRSFRDCKWWEHMKGEPYQKRRREGLTHWKPGPTPCFDDLMVTVLGPCWREKVNNSTLAQWRDTSYECINLICSMWQLPAHPRRKIVAVPAGVPRKKHTERYGNPEVMLKAEEADYKEQPHETDHSWVNNQQRFKCIVDSQALANAVNGKATLEDDSHRQLLSRLSSKVLCIIDGYGLHPPRDEDDPVEWRPRRYNQKADRMCNLILDGCQDVRVEGENSTAVLGLEPHLLVMTDG